MRHTGALLKDVPAAIRDRHSLAQPIIPLIMCGGAGTRLWPASREGRPKQFLPLVGPESTFQDTIRRVSDPALFGPPIVVTDAAAFAKVCSLAADAAAGGRIVTFGVRPTRPATEYGYIRAGQAIGPDIFAIEKFVEKPDAKTAELYVKDGYLWNAGNFMFRAGLLLDEYKKFEPDSAVAVAASVEGAGTDLG